MSRFSLIFTMLWSTIFLAQNDSFPKDYFQKPLNIPLFLSGNFGELRDDHFHSGLDYKTQQKEGFEVFASAEGYVSRIKISQWGYGKAIYISHPNGYSTVYGHLQKFNDTLEKYIKKIQYQKEDYEIEVFPKSDELLIKKGEIIGYSGDTGGSGGPHLHFEIRNTDSQIPINPMLFGLNIVDQVKPVVQTLYAYPLSENAQINQLASPVQVNIKMDGDGNYYSDSVFAHGRIGFAINAYDQQNGDVNRNGIYKIVTKLDNVIINSFDFEKFSFDESKFINLYIDYEHYKNFNSRLQKCFIEPSNKLSVYDNSIKTDGIIEVSEGKNHKVEIEVSDFEGNKSLVFIPIFGKKDSLALAKPIKETNYHVNYKEAKSVTLDNVEITFPKYIFYNDVDLNIMKNLDGSVSIHEDIIPLSKNFTISFDVSKWDKETRKHSFIAKMGKKNYLTYVSTEIKDHKLTGKPKTLGKYTVTQDFKAPIVTPLNFENEKWISTLDVLQVKIADELSGIKSFKAFINDEWILMEWNHKTGVLTYDFKDKIFKDPKHNFTISVTDNAQNTKTYSATFYRVTK